MSGTKQALSFLRYFKNRRIKKRALEMTPVLERLQSGDIMLVHTKGSILSSIIRKVTKSYWNHTALVLTNFARLPEYKTTIVIEVQDEGVIAHRIGNFLDPNKFDIAFKRVPNLSDGEKDMVRHYLLSHIDTPYDTARLFDILLGMLTGNMMAKFTNTKQAVCSSLIQKAFYHAMPEEKKRQVIFIRNFRNADDLEFASPADIARSEKAVWVFNPQNQH
jgi:hypothetical protein